jgi:hypothetical protein
MNRLSQDETTIPRTEAMRALALTRFLKAGPSAVTALICRLRWPSPIWPTLTCAIGLRNRRTGTRQYQVGMTIEDPDR